MLTETGRVVKVEADGLWIQTIRRSTCGACAVQSGCGHGVLNRIAGGTQGYIRVLHGDRAVEAYGIDDQVTIGIPESVILRGSFIAYVVPVLAMLAGALAAVQWLPGSEDPLGILGATGGLALGFALVRWHSKRHRRDPAFQPVLLGVVSPLIAPVTLL
jgi:sigma-E factor negative regulatory protein RseC